MEEKERTLSFISAKEEEEAKKVVADALGFPPPRMCGYFLAVKVYERPEDVHTFVDEDGVTKSLAIPSTTLSRDKFINCTGLVVAQGPDCYQHEQFQRSGAWCKVGDFIIFPRNEGTQINYRGVPMQILPDNKVYSIIEDPSYVSRD